MGALFFFQPLLVMGDSNKVALKSGTGAAVGGTVGGVAAGAGLVGAQAAATAAIPTAMSLGATIVPGVGSIMPVWMPALQMFAAGTLVSPVGVVLAGVAVGGAIGVAVARRGTGGSNQEETCSEEEVR